MSIVRRVAEKLGLEPGALEREAVTLWLRRRLRLLDAEIAEILARYGAASPEELEAMVRGGRVPEHPAWEDILVLERLESERRRILETLRQLEG